MSELGPVMIMAGGTGGHIFPGIAVGQELRAQGVPVLWLGSAAGLENRLVPEAGFALRTVAMVGLRGKGLLRLLSAPFVLTRAVFQALRVLRSTQPRSVLSLGGFAAGPGGIAAWLLRRPLIVHEQNRVPGMTNRLLAMLAKRVLCGFPQSFSRADAAVVGNPVRHEIAALPAPADRFDTRNGAAHLLVLGGSQGAQILNSRLPAALALLPDERRPKVRHQCGARHVEATVAAYRAAGVTADVEAFIADMAAAYAWADLVICRSGALTLAELAAAGVGSVLVPYRHAVDDHQTRNAEFLVAAGAARLLPEAAAEPARIAELLGAFLADRTALLAMATAARGQAQPDAAAAIARICLAEARP